MFYGLTHEELRGRRPLAKFLAIKLIVMLTFYQSFVVSQKLSTFLSFLIVSRSVLGNGGKGYSWYALEVCFRLNQSIIISQAHNFGRQQMWPMAWMLWLFVSRYGLLNLHVFWRFREFLIFDLRWSFFLSSCRGLTPPMNIPRRKDHPQRVSGKHSGIRRIFHVLLSVPCWSAIFCFHATFRINFS